MKKFFEKYYKGLIKGKLDEGDITFNPVTWLPQFILIIGLMFGLGFFNKLNFVSLTAIIIFSLLMIPIIITSMISTKNQMKRFEMVSTYLSNVLPIFIRKPKVLNTLRECSDLLEGKMRETVEKAVEYLETNVSDVSAEKTALKMIEDQFPNSRIIATHKLMLSIEHGNSKDYRDTCMVMYDDIISWINRIYVYQKELKSKRAQFILLSSVTAAMSCCLTFVYNSDEIFNGFSENILYQISTTVFLCAMLAIVAAAYAKLQGVWIVNDSTEKIEESALKAYEELKVKSSKITKNEIILSSIFFIGALAVYFILADVLIAAVCALAAAFVLVSPKLKYNSNMKKVQTALAIEFPIWLRNISINLKTLTVLNAISSSKKASSKIMAKEIEKFELESYKNPTSIVPYTNFMKEYGLTDVASSMKVLYSIQSYGSETVEAQVQGLIIRNQTLIEKSEKMKNEASISGIDLLGFVPMGAITIQMLINMILVMGTIMTNISTQIGW